MKIATWNVNSIRARVGPVLEWVKTHEPDVLLMQELKGAEFPGLIFQELGYASAAVTAEVVQRGGDAVAAEDGDGQHGTAGG